MNGEHLAPHLLQLNESVHVGPSSHAGHVAIAACGDEVSVPSRLELAVLPVVGSNGQSDG